MEQYQIQVFLICQGQMSSSSIFNNSANTNVTADQSGFKGTYNPSTGNLVVDANGKIFGGDKNINKRNCFSNFKFCY